MHRLGQGGSITALTKEEFAHLMQLIFASFYTDTPQGRIAAVATLKKGQGSELFSKGVVNSQIFKTKMKFGYQPVLVGDVSGELLGEYVERVRPCIVSESSSDFDMENSPLWLTSEGQPMSTAAAGRFVSAFFARHGLKITTTTCRAIAETESAEMLQDGKKSNLCVL